VRFGLALLTTMPVLQSAWRRIERIANGYVGVLVRTMSRGITIYHNVAPAGC